MKKYLRLILAVCLIFTGGFYFVGCAFEGRPSPVDESKVVFSDDFSGQELDRSKWNVEVTGRTVNGEHQAYVDSADVLSIVKGSEAGGAKNGALRIRGVWKPGYTTSDGRKFDFISGRINTRGKFEFPYGTWAARVKMSDSPGLWPAFWALGRGGWPATGEIDIFENVGETDWYNVAMHGPGYSGDTPMHARFHYPKDMKISDWHVYSVDWSPDSLVFKVDDKVIYTATKEMVTKYGRWAYDNPKYIILNLALGGAYPADVNKVKTPYSGLPESTVQFVKDGRADLLVDWVRVTKQ